MNQTILLEIDNLGVEVGRAANRVRAARGARLTLHRRSRLGLIGESGSGKTMMALAVLHLLPSTGTMTAGTIRYSGRDLTKLSESEMQSVRGKEISILYEDDGPGIPEGIKGEFLQRKPSEGSGFGVYLVKEILNIHKMEINEEGDHGQGVRYRISIPEDRWLMT